ncbi:PAS domain S-box protein [Antarcticibacterium arcticum]|uniref:histidine kinase n=1 Tax=Antarcticibacterium arcticum TaxID=2585771 RepID=A0A5B8YF31_9FLAO|nr:PAS domain-containing sensor histidine kinase [Antarcticibacterium arcticum]QED36572.1 PAS domain S-box protein [Antarcticibacterium arcticum]
MEVRNESKKIHVKRDKFKNARTFLDQLPILIITNIDNQRIEFINNMVEACCGAKANDILNETLNFHKDLLHPGDYLNYISHLKSFKANEEREICLRLKNCEGNWDTYIFKERLYTWNPNNEDRKAVISLGYKWVDDKKGNGHRGASVNNHTTKNSYHHLINSIDEAYCIIEMIFDKKGTAVDYLFLDTNPAFHRNVDLDDPIGKTMREMQPHLEEHWFETYGKVALTGKSIRFQEQAATPDKLWLDVYAFKIGHPYSSRVAITFHNITERKIAEEALIKTKLELEERGRQKEEELSENNRLLQTVFDSMNQGIVVFKTLYDQNGNISDFLFLRTNEILRHQYIGFDPVGKTYTEISRHGVEMGFFDAFKKVIETKETLDREVFYDKEGYNHWFRLIARTQDSLLIATIEDITARKLEAQKLKDAVRFKRQLVQTSPDTIIIINLDKFSVRYINQDMLARAGMTRKRILGLSLEEMITYIHPRDRESVMDFHRKILKSSEKDVLDIDFRVKTKGSDWEWFNARGKIFNRKNNTWVEEYVLLVRNITEQKDTQRALLNAERLSIQGEIARTFAHELRNPLASIRMTSDVIQHKIEGPQKKLLANYFKILSRSTKVLNNLVSNLLNSANYSTPILEKIDLAHCVNITLEKAADRIYLTGIKLVKKYKGPYYIMADAEKLQIALLNIIVNACEATPPDEGIIELSISRLKSDFKLSITDNGIGLEQEQISRLFDAFYTNKATGIGIGLNSVKNILEDHDARIEVSSKVNEGTTFHILFHDANMQ